MLEEFRFHITLTGNLSGAEARFFEAALKTHLAPLLEQSVSIDDICVFRQETQKDDFVLAERYALSGG